MKLLSALILIVFFLDYVTPRGKTYDDLHDILKGSNMTERSNHIQKAKIVKVKPEV